MATSEPREVIDIPIIINGRCKYPSASDRLHQIDYENGLRVRIPAMGESDLEALKEERTAITAALSSVSTDEITQFLNEAGDQWMARRSEGRRIADKYAHQITGFPPEMLTADYETIGHFMVNRYHAYDQIAAEFGHERIFDEWIPNQMCYVRAFPRGLLLHYLVGNLPLAGMYSILRGIMSRNCSLAKLPSRDPLTVFAFAKAMIDVDPEHPVSRSLSIAYWPHGAKIEDECLRSVDSVCIWGGAAAVETLKRKIPANVPVAEYGPKWSASVIDLTRCDPEEAAYRLVEDVSFYDQEACFSTQRAFVLGPVEEFRSHLRKYFDHFAKRFPLVSGNRDALAHRSATLLQARYSGLEVDQGEHWAVVVIKDGEAGSLPHPLTRTLFLHPVASLSAVRSYLDQHTQTISLLPWEIASEHRDEWALAGANRLVELGWSRLPRAGFTHDGTHGMHPLVRLVSQERPRNDFGKYYLRPGNRKDWQRPYFLGDRWWSDPWWFLAGRDAVTG